MSSASEKNSDSDQRCHDVFGEACKISNNDVNLTNLEVGNAIKYEVQVKEEVEGSIIGSYISDCIEIVLKQLISIIFSHYRANEEIAHRYIQQSLYRKKRSCQCHYEIQIYGARNKRQDTGV